jgi:virulence-associated protein VapD
MFNHTWNTEDSASQVYTHEHLDLRTTLSEHKYLLQLGVCVYISHQFKIPRTLNLLEIASSFLAVSMLVTVNIYYRTDIFVL